jgi:MOSC domain-containing protein YiiM
MSDARVESIHVYPVEGGPGQRAREIEIRTDHGIVGDHRSKSDSKRQLTLIDSAVLEDVARIIDKDIPDGASRRQVRVSGVDLNTTIGKTLTLGNVTVKVESDCPPCNIMETAVGPGARQALQGRAGVCCRVIGGGVLREGDPLRVAE